MSTDFLQKNLLYIIFCVTLQRRKKVKDQYPY